MAEANEAAKAPTGGGGLTFGAISLAVVGGWQMVTLDAGSGIMLTVVTVMLCAFIVAVCHGVAVTRRWWPAVGTPHARHVAAWNLAACRAVVAQGWALAVAAGGCVAVGIGAGYVAFIGWPRVHPGVVGPAWLPGAAAMLVAFGLAGNLSASAVRRLRDPHAVLMRHSRTNPAHQVQRVTSTVAVCLGGVLVAFGLWLPLSVGGGVEMASWVVGGILAGGGVIPLAAGITLRRQLAAVVPAADLAAPAVKIDPRSRGLLRLAGAGGVTVVAVVAASLHSFAAGAAFACYGIVPVALAGMGLLDVAVRARRRPVDTAAQS